MQSEIFERPPINPSLDRFAQILLDHLSHKYNHVIEMEPMPTPRPRFTVMWKSFASLFGKTFTPAFVQELKKLSWVNTYHPNEYTKYKEELARILRDRKRSGEIKEDAGYTMLTVTFYHAYPASTPKKKLIDLAPHFKKPDGDNLLKGLMDAMGDAGIFANDSNIADFCVRKCYTTQPSGYMAFSLA